MTSISDVPLKDGNGNLKYDEKGRIETSRQITTITSQDNNKSSGTFQGKTDGQTGKIVAARGRSKWCCTLFMRQTPFVNPIVNYTKSMARWSNLPTCNVHKDDIVNFSLEKSDAEVMNWFYTYFSGDLIDSRLKRVLGTAIMFPNSVDTYGWRVYELTTRIFGDLSAAGVKTEEQKKAYKTKLDGFLVWMSELNKLIAGWHFRNQELASGQMVVMGNQDYRIGNRIVTELQRIIYEGYVERVSHSFVNFGEWLSTLGVTRMDEISSKQYLKKVVKMSNPYISEQASFKPMTEGDFIK
jgi:hypothetical protein